MNIIHFPDTAPPIFNLVVELSCFVYFLFCLRNAWSRGRFSFLTLLAAAAFAFGFELDCTRTIHAYTYDNRFLVMVGGDPGVVPLWIVLTWSIIIYVVMGTTELLKAPLLARPWIEGLFGVSLDYSLDPILAKSRFVPDFTKPCNLPEFPSAGAEGMGTWTWCIPEKVVWLEKSFWGIKMELPIFYRDLFFGVPLSNFFSWFAAVAAFTIVYHCVKAKLKPEQMSLPAQVGVLALVVVLAKILFSLAAVGFNLLAYYLLPEWTMVGAQLAIAVVVLLVVWRTLQGNHPIRILYIWLPIVNTLIGLAAYFTLDGPPNLLLVVIVMGIVSLALFAIPYWLRRPFNQRDEGSLANA